MATLGLKMENFTDSKREALHLDGTPSKRMFWSIISDYDLTTAITELTDNAIDLWQRNGKTHPLEIKIELNTDRQLITISDNAGGLKESDLSLLISPGGSNNDPFSASIGVFGVGSKRAVVALAQLVSVKTRYGSNKTFQIDVDETWLESDSWELPAYEIPPIENGCTVIELSRLRFVLGHQDPLDLIEHLGETYSAFLQPNSCSIAVNEIPVLPKRFDDWTFAGELSPRRVLFRIKPDGQHDVVVEVTAGLIRHRDPVFENYGVNIYCNDRLVTKHLKTRDVGYFVTGEAGVPHPDISLCRANVSFAGPARLMPWNSSKTGINPSHATFLNVRPTIVKLVSFYSKSSRATRDVWEDQIFNCDSGEFIDTTVEEALDVKKIVLPPVPKSRKTSLEHLKDRNVQVIADEPWTLGLVESIAAADFIRRQKFDTRNRIALILLDSNFEIALKEFIVHHPRLSQNINLKNLFSNRDAVINHVLTEVNIDGQLLVIVKHYYQIRNKLVHEKATLGVTDSDVERFRDVVISILSTLFNLKF